MVCALCLEKEASKINTHYLTDAIIRTCLNLKGNRLYNFMPPNYLRQRFIDGIVRNKDNTLLNYTEEQIVVYTNNFFNRLRFR